MVHYIRMDENEKVKGAGAQAYEEAAERSRRLRAWLDGVLKGGPQPTEIATDWRQGMEFYEAQKRIPEDEEDHATMKVKSVEELLFEAVGAIRKRRQAEGKPLEEISEEERARRFLEMVEKLKKDGAEGKEATPMDLVLAARYVEGY